jgi:hypothetical protein
MATETLSEALSHGWRVTARCIGGVEDDRRSRRACIYRRELDLETLVWTRGPNFPLSRLESRVMCPRCGSRQVSLLFTIPREPQVRRVQERGER